MGQFNMLMGAQMDCCHTTTSCSMALKDVDERENYQLAELWEIFVAMNLVLKEKCCHRTEQFRMENRKRKIMRLGSTGVWRIQFISLNLSFARLFKKEIVMGHSYVMFVFVSYWCIKNDHSLSGLKNYLTILYVRSPGRLPKLRY